MNNHDECHPLCATAAHRFVLFASSKLAVTNFTFVEPPPLRKCKYITSLVERIFW